MATTTTGATIATTTATKTDKKKQDLEKRGGKRSPRNKKIK